MEKENDRIPAWILCSDLLIKLKNELANEAIAVLEGEIKAGRISIGGSVITQPDEQSDGENKLFVVNNLINDRVAMHEKYDFLIAEFESNPSKFDGKTAERMEGLKKFVLAVDEMRMLMAYSQMMDRWAEETTHHVRENSISEIIRATMQDDAGRREALRFVLSLKSFIKESILSEQERQELAQAISS
ncbi:MAG: hypothetical protein M1158_00290 [Candidatus Marsarchaeota archaeon]|jgi:hypothetical protein|nr:hypothetical protein [Candidatus Marsarchaeota archaeon]